MNFGAQCRGLCLTLRLTRRLTTARPAVHLSEPGVRSQMCTKALNSGLHKDDEERLQPSIKGVFMATEITLSTTGNPAGVPADLRAAEAIRTSEGHAHHSANDLAQAGEVGPERLIPSADKTMLILTCGWR